MFRLLAFINRSRARRLAIADLRQLSAHQLDDIGLSDDRLGEVVDSMLSRPAPFDLARRIKPEMDLRSFSPAAPIFDPPL